MAIAPRIQPLSAHLQCPCANPADSDDRQGKQQQQQLYTVWMKSLVFSGRGGTVYGQDGRAAYRVDNYACRRRREVFVMDSAGRTLLKLLKKNFGVFKTWQGYSRCSNGGAASGEPWFRVQKEHRILKKKGGQCSVRAVAEIAMSGEVYRIIDGMSHKSDYRIIGAGDEVLAEIKRKQTEAGVVLGEDVLSLTVGPTADRLLVVGLVVVCGLLDRCI
uniref:Protein LURP-one-related 11 n=1 Tax=Oryza brachyantha TaxID=4533 RepID=J3L7I7_ORYBR